MLIDAKQSALLVVDVQGKLVPAISGWQALLDHVVWLIRVARRMDVPVLACEQYPQGLGPTHPLIAAELPALRESAPRTAATSSAIVCVLQTVMELLAGGRQVFVVEEAVGSRRESDKALALARMREAGASIVSREMVAFEWLRKADSDLFREISRNFLR